MIIEAAIKTAIEYETRILAVYTQATEKVEDARGQKAPANASVYLRPSDRALGLVQISQLL